MATRELSLGEGPPSARSLVSRELSRSCDDESASVSALESDVEEFAPLCDGSAGDAGGLGGAWGAGRVWRPVLAVTFALALVACGAAAFRAPTFEPPALRPAPAGVGPVAAAADFVPAPAPPARQLALLQSPELRRAVVAQVTAFSRMRFDHGRRMTSGESDPDEDSLPEGDELEAAVDQELQHFIEELSARHPDIAATLNSTNVTQAHWDSVHQVLQGVSDPRVIDIGLDIAHALGGDSEAPADESPLSESARRRVNETLTMRSSEMRRLRDELIPASVRDLGSQGADHWDAVISSQGVRVLGQVGHWKTEFDVTTVGRRLSGVFRLILGSSIATVFSVLTTVLTAVFGQAMSRFIWSMQGLAAVATCMAGLFTFMIPCIIEAGFFGIEAIWVWLK